jgi:general secretion pathway protein A
VQEATAGRRFTWADAGIVAVILGLGASWFWWQGRAAPDIAARVAAVTEPVAAAPAPVEIPAPAADPATTLDQLLRAAQPLPVVLSRLLEVWGATPQVQPGENVCQALVREQIGCYKSLGDWQNLRQLNRPAILTLSSGRGGVQHVLLRELGAGEALLETAAGPMRLPLAQIDLLWTGEFLLLWRREGGESLIGPESPPNAIAWLRQKLAEAEGRALSPPVSAKFDDELRQSLLRFQAAQTLDRDGLAGPRTLIALGNLKPAAGTPTLAATGTNHVAHP